MGYEPIDKKRELTRKGMAAHLKVSPRTLDRWAREGVSGVKMTPRRVGGRLRYTLADYEEFQREIDRIKARVCGPTSSESRKQKREALDRLEAHGLRIHKG
jgi:hypothetical protein